MRRVHAGSAVNARQFLWIWLVSSEPPADLRDGLCVGDWDTWDPQNDGETADVADARHQRAIALCQSGPVRAECAAWLPGLPSCKGGTVAFQK